MKLWKDNRINQEWEASTNEIAERFLKSEQAKHVLQGCPLRRALLFFISDSSGLSSVFEDAENDLQAIERQVLDGLRQYERANCT